jgi:hypothetical protein
MTRYSNTATAPKRELEEILYVERARSMHMLRVSARSDGCGNT